MSGTQQLLLTEGGGAIPNYIEDVFSTYLYTGNGSTQTITNNIDLSTKGGLVWIKKRDAAPWHILTDTARGAGNEIYSNDTSAQASGGGLTSFTSSGFSLNSANSVNNITGGFTQYVSWTFRKQPKFFDVVTYTGNDAVRRQISHALGSVPGCIMVKCTSNAQDWFVNHRSLAGPNYGLNLNLTDAQYASQNWGNAGGVYPTSTDFTVGDNTNVAGRTYVAYLFAHDAGGFGLTGTDNVISCGSYTGNGSASGPSVNLGYEPQWVLCKRVDSTSNWHIQDNMRGMPVTGNTCLLLPNSSASEYNNIGLYMAPNATGFQILTSDSAYNASGGSYIYIAIRRGPMKVPTDGTTVFEPVAYSGTGTNNRQISSTVTPDAIIPAYRNNAVAKYWYDRLRGNGTYLITSGTNAEGTDGAAYGPQFNKVQTGYQQGSSDSGFFNEAAYTYINYLLRRAPSFFDEVCYTGTGSAGTQTHNLGVAPELVIIKKRSTTGNWLVGASFTSTTSKVGYLNTNYDLGTASYSSGGGFSGQPTSTTFSVGTDTSVNASGDTYVAYLFATCAGVSKVGSYTGTGTLTTINCGFTGGARFVLIKRTDSTSNWFVWDTARGMVAGTDPSLALNSTAAESNANSVYTATTGFQLLASPSADVNTNGGTYIYLAIA